MKGVAAVLVLGVLVPGGIYLGLTLPRGGQEGPATRAGETLGERHQLVYVLITASFCSAATDPVVRERLRSVPAMLRGNLPPGVELRTKGVAVDPSANVGWEVLKSFGGFDEMSVGAGWQNGASLKHIWSASTGIAQVPQIILLYRRLDIARYHIDLLAEEEILRLTGKSPLTDWLDNGAPIPPLPRAPIVADTVNPD